MPSSLWRRSVGGERCSNLPGEGGLWRNYRAEELATPQAFARDPSLVWEWYNMRRETLATIKPNPAHTALATLEGRVEDFTLITQNVDGLHEMGGSRNVIELHGNIWRVRCTGCGRVTENRATFLLPSLHRAGVRRSFTAPHRLVRGGPPRRRHHCRLWSAGEV